MKAPKPADPARSALMARVRQKGTAAELVVATSLRSLGASYRVNVRKLPGSPDFANRTRKWAVFVHGCFWHQHARCKRATVPKSNRKFWQEKFASNRQRDQRAIRKLRRSGYRVAVVWECETSDDDLIRAKLSQILESRRVDVRKTVDH
ncbi:MAG TPA: very short patch repair endonuclease [Xanthobacteraceae bacterium]|jgi:DNA mismatch endonuclease Vsr|nr:very short patch repair endonuclease [Xanthobacteraceae bacterium]